MDRAHWSSPSFRGRSPHHRQGNPRFRGDGGFGPPRHFSPQWQQRSPSPYRYQSQQAGSYSPHFQQQNYHHHPYATSTPLHGSGGRRPFFRGGGRFNKRQSFGSPSFGKGDDIENWVSPEMWADPWRHLTTPTTSVTQLSDVTTNETRQEGTNFAESDFNVTPSGHDSFMQETQSDGASRTKFADSDFDVTDNKGLTIELKQTQPPVKHSQGNSASELSATSLASNKDEIDLDDDEFERLATDRVVLDTSDTSQS